MSPSAAQLAMLFMPRLVRNPDRPILPVEIDRVLLKDCAQRIGEYKTDLQGVRRTLREAFWQKLDELI